MEASVPQRLREVAESVVALFKERLGKELTYDAAGVAVLDDYIEEVRAQSSPSDLAALIPSFGAFLGEAMIASYGGEWKLYAEDQSWRVLVQGKLWANPIAKVAKQFEEGPGDSIRSFFSAAPALLKLDPKDPRA